MQRKNLPQNSILNLEALEKKVSTFARNIMPQGVVVTPELAMALGALPLYGGTAPEGGADTTDTTDKPKEKETTTITTETSKSSGGSEGSGSPELSPQEISDLLKQVETLTTSVQTLSKENETYKSKDAEAERAKLSHEQQQEQDIQRLTEIIGKQENALKNQALINAINSYKDIEFHDMKSVIGWLDPSVRDDMEVDLDAGTCTVKGIENELKRIAGEKDWAVKKRNLPDNDKTKQQQSSTTTRRGSGAPPPPPGGANGGQARRQALIDRHPVLQQSRVKMPT